MVLTKLGHDEDKVGLSLLDLWLVLGGRRLLVILVLFLDSIKMLTNQEKRAILSCHIFFAKKRFIRKKLPKIMFPYLKVNY